MINKTKKIVKLGLRTISNPRRAKAELVVVKRQHESRVSRKREYIKWHKQNKMTDSDIISQRELADNLKFRPLVSVLVPTYNTDPKYLRECIESVITQTYTNWELCISDDASPNKITKEIIKSYTKQYKNIKAVFNKVNQHIAGSSNVALTVAKGEFISLLDHDDLLTPNALYETVLAINNNPDVDLVYSDEDKLEGDRYHVEPFFKPDWSPDFLNSCNYITHFATIRARVMNDVGGFTLGTHGAQDWDLFLRITAKTDKIHHIPKILYTWRKSATSTAQSSDSKPYAYINQKKVLRKSIADRSINAYVEGHVSLGFWRVRYAIKGNPLVSIVVPTKDNYQLIKQCVDSILETTSYPYFEIVIVDTGSESKKVLDYYESLVKSNQAVRVLNWNKPFNFSAACNYGASKSKGDYLLFLNNDTEVITADWIQGLLEHAQQPNNGMVGAKLMFPNHTVQHAGVVLSAKDVAFHPFYGQNPLIDIFNYIYIANIRNVSAVTAACSMVSKDKFNKVGGFDTKLRVTYNDVDLCLRLLDEGYKNVYTPFVELFHYESMSVGKISTGDRDQVEFKEAKNIMEKRWNKYLKNDPYYNANFEQFGPGYRLPLQ